MFRAEFEMFVFRNLEFLLHPTNSIRRARRSIYLDYPTLSFLRALQATLTTTPFLDSGMLSAYETICSKDEMVLVDYVGNMLSVATQSSPCHRLRGLLHRYLSIGLRLTALISDSKGLCRWSEIEI